MVVLKNSSEVRGMIAAGKLSAQALKLAGEMVEPGVTTSEIDREVRKFIQSHGAEPSFLGYGGFTGSACISINEQVIHGIPGPRKIQEGDIVSVDVGAFFKGFHGDNAATFGAGRVSPEAQALMDATRESLYKGIAMAKPGNRLGDISHAIQSYVEALGYGVVREYVGHGVGRKAGHGVRLLPGMTIAIEPMINQGTANVRQLPDGWTVVTADGKLSAHFEHTIAITDQGPLILTQC